MEEFKTSTKYIVLHTIFKDAWDQKPNAKERFFEWFREDSKKRADLESQLRLKEQENERLRESLWNIRHEILMLNYSDSELVLEMLNRLINQEHGS